MTTDGLLELDHDQLVEQRGRCWVFTLNGLSVPWADWDTGTVYDFIESLSKLAHVRYICGGVEAGDNTERLHFQGYVEFTKSQRWTNVGKMLDSRFTILKHNPKRKKLRKGYSEAKKGKPHSLTYISRKKGSREQAKDYALKQNEYADESSTQVLQPIQFGKWVENGQRLDLEDLATQIIHNESDYQIFSKDPVAFMRHIKMIRETRQMLHHQKFSNIYRHVEVCYISGESRCGKTSLITKHFGYENIHRITDSKNPWDGYHDQDVVIFEEFRETFSLENMLSWLEGHPVELPARYFNRIASYTKVFIISNWKWDKQYENLRYNNIEDYEALVKRVHHHLEFIPDQNSYKIISHSHSNLINIFSHPITQALPPRLGVEGLI